MTLSHSTPGFEWTHRTDAYATHQPVLYEAIKLSEDWYPNLNILELGVGNGSTKLIHSVASPETSVVSIETDLDWAKKFAKHIKKNRYLIMVGDWDELYEDWMDTYGLVFIDMGSWEARLKAVKNFIDSKIVIVHDSDYLEREFAPFKFADHYKYYKTFMPLQPYPYMTGPPTTIMSNHLDVTLLDVNYEDYK